MCELRIASVMNEANIQRNASRSRQTFKTLPNISCDYFNSGMLLLFPSIYENLLRSTMMSCRLNTLFLLYVYQDITTCNSVDLCKIAREFVAVNTHIECAILESFKLL